MSWEQKGFRWFFHFVKVWKSSGQACSLLWWAIASHFMGCHGFFWGLLLIYDQETNQRRRRINGDNTFITTHSVRFTGQSLNSYLNLRLQVFKISEIISIWSAYYYLFILFKIPCQMAKNQNYIFRFSLKWDFRYFLMPHAAWIYEEMCYLMFQY